MTSLTCSATASLQDGLKSYIFCAFYYPQVKSVLSVAKKLPQKVELLYIYFLWNVSLTYNNLIWISCLFRGYEDEQYVFQLISINVVN